MVLFGCSCDRIDFIYEFSPMKHSGHDHVYIHVILCFENTFILLCNSCLCVACGIVFNTAVSTDFSVLITFFCSRMDFYCLKLIVLLQCSSG